MRTFVNLYPTSERYIKLLNNETFQLPVDFSCFVVNCQNSNHSRAEVYLNDAPT
jgi:hypothetical protein